MAAVGLIVLISPAVLVVADSSSMADPGVAEQRESQP